MQSDGPMSTAHSAEERDVRPFAARWIHRLAIPIILLWVGLTVVLTLFVPSLEVVEREHSVPLIAADAPSTKAAERMGEAFSDSGSGNMAVLVLEGQQALGGDAHDYYDELVRKLNADPAHVKHVEDFWGDPLTAAAAQSADGKAVYVQVALVGAPGSAEGVASVVAVQQIIKQTQAPPGVEAFVTGPGAIIADMGASGNNTILLITVVTFAVIFLMLLIVFRSFITTIVILLTVLIELQVARGIVAFLGLHGLVGLTTFVVNLLVSVGIAAGTDYGIFFVGRYQEARQAGEDREKAYYTTYRGVAKVVLASGVTIAGAIACLYFTRLPYFQPLGVPGAIGILVAVAVALTLVPAIMAAGGRFGMFDPKRRRIKSHGWQRIGTATVRWPVPILAATLAISLIGLLTLPGYHPSYNDQKYIPQDIPANLGYAAAERHFPESKLTVPDLLVVQSDHDLRNPADMLVLNKLAKAVFAVPGIATVQSVTRPEGTQIARTTIPFMISSASGSQLLNLPFQMQRMDDMLEQADQMGVTIGIMTHMYELMQQMVATTHSMVGVTHELQDTTEDLRDSLSDFDDFFRPIRNYFHWEPHCVNIPICWSLRSLFIAFDGVDQITVKMEDLVKNLDQLDLLLPQMLAQFPQMISIMQSMQTMMYTMHSTMSGTMGAMSDQENSTAMAKAFNAAKNDDTFYLPPEIFENADFKRVMDIFMSPDGKSARMLISQKSDPATPEGMERVDPIKTAAEEALKGTPLENSNIYLAGTAATVKDLVDGSTYDLLIAGVAALCLIFIIMLIMTRSFVAALVIVGTVVISMGASFGLSILVWQHLLGVQIHWVVVAMSVIVLLAVGSDYNLMLVSRMKEEIGAGLNTGIIRAMGGTGRVVTAAGLVFAATMGSMMVSDLRTIGQVGTTIGLGLLFDTMVVRAFMTPAIAALLGRWFWWPQRVRTRPASGLLRSVGPRPLVRALLLRN